MKMVGRMKKFGEHIADYARNGAQTAGQYLKKKAGDLGSHLPVIGTEIEYARGKQAAAYRERAGVDSEARHAAAEVDTLLKSIIEQEKRELGRVHALEASITAIEADFEARAEKGGISHEKVRDIFAPIRERLHDVYGVLKGSYEAMQEAKSDYIHRKRHKSGGASVLESYISTGGGYSAATLFIFIGALGTIAFLAPSITGAAIGTARLSPTLLLPFIFSLITLVGVLLYVRKSR